MPRLAVPFRRAGRSTRTRALVVHCHPSPVSFVAAARDRVLAGLQATDAEIRTFDLYAEGFTPEFSAGERAAHLAPGADPTIAEHAEALQWCDTLILVYPTWWAGQPAMLKGWFDRVFVSGVAWELPDGANRLQPKLRNVKRIVAVTTHGSPKYINAIEGEGGKRTLTRALRAMCHPLCRVNWIALYGVDKCSEAARLKFLDRTEARITALTR
jgi:NAD(P)H dehydrogenase (quinone)